MRKWKDEHVGVAWIYWTILDLTAVEDVVSWPFQTQIQTKK